MTYSTHVEAPCHTMPLVGQLYPPSCLEVASASLLLSVTQIAAAVLMLLGNSSYSRSTPSPVCTDILYGYQTVIYWQKFNHSMVFTVVSRSRAWNLSSCVAADRSNASCLFSNNSTAASESCKIAFMLNDTLVYTEQCTELRVSSLMSN